MLEETVPEIAIIENSIIEEHNMEETVLEKEIIENPVIEEHNMEETVLEKEIVENPVIEEDVIDEPIEHWYVSLLHYHDYTTFKIRQLSIYYGINPMNVPSYDDFWKKIINQSTLNEVLDIIRQKWNYEHNRR
jgi:hypothetical protein